MREILFIKRRENPFDPWSGDIGFPGGGVKTGEDYVEAALRETEEEVGISREYLRVVGVLGVEHTLIYPEMKIGIVLSKLVVDNVVVRPAWAEVSDVYWISLDDIIGPARMYHPVKKTIVKAYIVGGRYIVWGLTRKILDKYLKVVRDAD